MLILRVCQVEDEEFGQASSKEVYDDCSRWLVVWKGYCCGGLTVYAKV